MGAVWLLLLIVLSVFAVVGGRGRWKLLNLLIIVAFIAGGLVVGLGLGAWGNNMEIGAHVAVPLMILLGAVGAFGCIRRNKRREKARVGGVT
jgi:peptidoglycan/LPS O-acetylase OafA/YrhL